MTVNESAQFQRQGTPQTVKDSKLKKELVFEMESSCVAQAGLELVIFLLLPPECQKDHFKKCSPG